VYFRSNPLFAVNETDTLKVGSESLVYNEIFNLLHDARFFHALAKQVSEQKACNSENAKHKQGQRLIH
jgi:hypothetical protein